MPRPHPHRHPPHQTAALVSLIYISSCSGSQCPINCTKLTPNGTGHYICTRPKYGHLDGHLDMDTLIWTPWYGHLDMDTLIWTPWYGHLDMDTLIWTPWYGHLDMDTLIWTPWYGHLDMDTLIWTPWYGHLDMDTLIWTPWYGHLDMDTLIWTPWYGHFDMDTLIWTPWYGHLDMWLFTWRESPSQQPGRSWRWHASTSQQRGAEPIALPGNMTHLFSMDVCFTCWDSTVPDSNQWRAYLLIEPPGSRSLASRPRALAGPAYLVHQTPVLQPCCARLVTCSIVGCEGLGGWHGDQLFAGDLAVPTAACTTLSSGWGCGCVGGRGVDLHRSQTLYERL